ncbi:hypothetical protein [Actinacidiphila sp. ITFR-21]|nr:hypothetical protein [Streptomyces sp. ITFR-21]WNI15553.1 hypothetical protein RLT57_08455 [Streptomyces sp. ITFR-21]
MTATFTARYEGWCAECGAEIEPGDTAGYLDDEVCCEDCVESAAED